ncbi:Uncharacterized protein dnl_26210 [Desulfonema limicola]|uniref:Uncharacterized protein n=1 Tax=Desulfonema limicola TaxID=45656 RepID=A0A975GGK0_9BACT|nr:Uncharacterized protein dnl_26210 [Desulfonema limicola]
MNQDSQDLRIFRIFFNQALPGILKILKSCESWFRQKRKENI